LKGPGFNPRAYEVETWFQAFAFTCNLYRYTEAVRFPFLALLVSGGHNQLILACGVGDYTILGSTLVRLTDMVPSPPTLPHWRCAISTSVERKTRKENASKL
jgi:hypothetical protein